MKKICTFSFVLLVFFSTLAHSQSVTLWGTQHAISAQPGQSQVNCEAQSKIVENLIREGKPTGVSNLLFASEFFNSPNTKSDKLLVLEDLNVKKYVTFYMDASKLISTIDVNLKNGALPNAVDHPIFLGRLNNYLSAIIVADPNDSLDQSILTILKNDHSLPYIATIENDLANAKQGKAVIAGNGILWTLADYVGDPYNATYKQNLSTALTNHITFTNKVANDFFAKQLKKRESEYNVTINRPGSQYNGKKIFTLVDPSILFGDSLRYQNHDELDDLLVYYWRNIFYAKNVINLIKKYPNANILVWMGVGHIDGLAKNLNTSNGLTAAQKENIGVISSLTNQSLACNSSQVLKSISTKTGIEKLPAWLAKYGTKTK